LRNYVTLFPEEQAYPKVMELENRKPGGQTGIVSQKEFERNFDLFTEGLPYLFLFQFFIIQATKKKKKKENEKERKKKFKKILLKERKKIQRDFIKINQDR